MKSTFPDNLTELSREEKLQIFLQRNRISFRFLGVRMDMTGTAVSSLCRGETMPTRRHAELVALGIPVELLPRPEDIKPGPRPKTQAPAHAA